MQRDGQKVGLTQNDYVNYVQALLRVSCCDKNKKEKYLTVAANIEMNRYYILANRLWFLSK